MPPEHIAILGGGLTGLTSAFYLSRRFPLARVTIIEKSNRLGGWVKSERVRLSPESTVLLESGPRTLRPNGKGLLELINLLDLTPQLVATSKRAPAAQHRYLHIPPDAGIVALPSSAVGLITSPLRGLLIWPVIREAFLPSNRESAWLSGSPTSSQIFASGEDESVHSFLARRFGAEFARVFGSSLVHGIYAADSRRISVRAVFGTLWQAEELGRGSVVRGFVKRLLGSGQQEDERGGYEFGEVAERLGGAAVFSFMNGTGTITRALEQSLRMRSGLQLKLGAGVTSVSYNRRKEIFEVTTAGETIWASHIVSALPLPILASVLPPTQQLPHLTANSSSSVTVINLVFPTDPLRPIHPPGFGYLIPRAPDGYSLNDPADGILGCVFDSCAVQNQDTGPLYTKITVMLGGPYPHCLPSLDAILRRLQRHLALPAPLPEPIFHRIHQHQDCIPILGVGHLQRMHEMRKALNSEEWGCGRLEVVGAGVGGVSVADCIEGGRSAGQTWS